MHTDRTPAVLGGTPIFSEKKQLVRPVLPAMSELIPLMEQLYETRILSNHGGFAAELEERLAHYLGVREMVLFNNGTTALTAVLSMLPHKGQVVVPSFTFVATAHAVVWAGHEPVFAEMDPATLNLNPESAAEALRGCDTPAAVVPVHLFGLPCDVDGFTEVGREFDVPVIYDAAHAFGSEYKGKSVGGFGAAEVFSFHATKPYHTVEGGGIALNDSARAEELRSIRNFGFCRYLDADKLGLNGKMNEISSLIGLKLLDAADQHLETRRWVFRQYREVMSNLPGVRFPDADYAYKSNCSYFCLIIDEELFGLSAAGLYHALLDENIITRCYFTPPVHKTTYYKDRYAPRVDLSRTEAAARSTICLPVYADMTVEELARISEAVVSVRNHAAEVRSVVCGRSL